MAGCLDHRNKTKCSGYRKGPILRSWICRTVVQFLITLPCIFSFCLGVDNTVSMFPERDIALEYGRPLEMYCVAEKNCSSSDINFFLGEKLLESEIVNSTTRRLITPSENFGKNTVTIYCKDKKNDKWCLKRVTIDTRPENVTNFKCTSDNFETLNCSFVTQKLISTTNYSLSFSIADNVVNPPCAATKISYTNTWFCVWDALNSTPRYRQTEEQLYFTLNAHNPFGDNTQNFIVDHYAIVKPEAPLDLKVIKNGTHSVTLRWKVHNNVYDFLNCYYDHIIEYQIAKIDNKTHFHRVNTSHLHNHEITYNYTLNNLPYAHVQYEVRVYIKSKKAVSEEFWSNASFIFFYTLSERPQRPPDMIAGAFAHNTYDDRRMIYVYWKQLEEYEEAGTNFTYKVVTTQGNTTRTTLLDRTKSLGYIFLNTSLEAIDVTVWSYNSEGSSVNSSHIYIPPDQQTYSLKPKSFTKLAYENGTYELSWVGIKNIHNYTLFWCQHNQSKLCTGRIDFTVLSPNADKHVIDLPNQYRYQFAIAANNGSQSSGMIWAIYCDISKDGYVMYGYPVRLKFDTPGKRFVTLKWEMDCAVQEGIILGYNISYCPIIETSSNCDPTFDNLYKYVENAKNTTTKIENLIPYKTYQFTLALRTVYGLKNIENATWVITTSEDVPTKPISLQITDVRNDSLRISWEPPLQRNGNIGKYVILNYDSEFYIDNVLGADKSRRQVLLTGLQGFTNYSFAVKACNIPLNVCSEVSPNDYLFVRTRIGPPGKLRAPTVRNPDMLSWEPPKYPSGTLDKYEVRRVRDDMQPEIFNTTELSMSIVHCEGGISSEFYQVRAVNFDEDLYHGVLFMNNVDPPIRANRTGMDEYAGEWSEPSSVACKSKDGLTIILAFVGIFAAVGVAYGSIKIYKSYRKMEDIKPVLPHGLGEPEKDISKFTFGGWNPNNTEEKPSSDEMLLLPNSKSITTSTDTKLKDSNGETNEQTDSTALSDASKGSIDRQESTSDEGSDTSLHLEIEPVKSKNEDEERASSSVDSESSCESSPYLSNEMFKKNPLSGYTQQVVSADTGYATSQMPDISRTPTPAPPQPASSSYVMASLPPPAYSGGALSYNSNPMSPLSGYVLREELQANLMLRKATAKSLGEDTLHTAPSLPPPDKLDSDSNYMQLQALDSLPTLKPTIKTALPLKPNASGYVSPTDQVMNKHLNNILTAGQLTEESAILDPSMSPDAYCRFSWSTDPANDNLHSLLADSLSRTSNN